MCLSLIHILASGPTLRQLADSSNPLGGSDVASKRLKLIEDLSARTSGLAEMDFLFLFDPARKIFSTGFNVGTRRRDNSFYDLLASEARLTSYVAVALGQVSQEHWFALSRLLVAGHGEPTLASWSGSMFEYLMPLLVKMCIRDRFMKSSLVLLVLIAAAPSVHAYDHAKLCADLAKSERNFCDQVAMLGLDNAFLANMADECFIPYNFGLTRADYEMQAKAAREKAGETGKGGPDPNVQLVWSPSKVDVSADGTLGYTWGHYTYSERAKDGKVATAEGLSLIHI